MGDIVLRACCATAATCGRKAGFVELEDNPASPSVGDAPILARNVAPLISPSVAVHEASHTVVGLLLGAEVTLARIGISASAGVWFHPEAPRHHRAAVFLAGPIAEAWSSRWVVRQGDDDLRWYRDRVRDVDLGNCDHCRAMFWTIGENSRREEAETFARYREIEEQTIATVQRPEVWRAIKRVADALIKHGEIEGEHIRALVDCNAIEIN